MPWRLAPPAALVTALLLLPARAFAQAAPDPRADLQAVQSALVVAVAKVSRNGTNLILGGDLCRGYHLKGLGAVFILAPRALPEEGRLFVIRGRAQTGVARLRQEQRRLQREAQSLVQQGRADEAELREQQVKTMEEQAETLQRQAERDRQKAEQEFEEFTQEVHIRLGPPPLSRRPGASGSSPRARRTPAGPDRSSPMSAPPSPAPSKARAPACGSCTRRSPWWWRWTSSPGPPS